MAFQMNKSVEARARAQCALDAEIAGVRRDKIPALVDRLWPATAATMIGMHDPETVIVPADIADREREYEHLQR